VKTELHSFAPTQVPAIAVLAWRPSGPMRAASTAAVGGGIGIRHWVLNAQVAHDYARRDTEAHVGEIAGALGLDAGRSGVGMLTAAPVAGFRAAKDGGVLVEATVGLSRPVLAAAPDEEDDSRSPGTINIVAVLPVSHGDAALANLLCTVTEAKVQALYDAGVAGTGTASDAVTILCPDGAAAEPFGGPRSTFGARLARATYEAVLTGART
jgi:adenosylcobinamide amidohydrolase